MIKPTGAACNLDCHYCYYSEKSAYYPGSRMRMDDETLERVTAAYLQAHPGPDVIFGWQGGEPLLMGLEFFEKAVSMQKKHARPGQRVENAIQTNATQVDDAWAEFFAANRFLVGVSIDGPEELHDHYRRERGGGPSYARVIAGLEFLQQHNVDVNALVTVNRVNVDHPTKVYRHLVNLGLEHLQLIPIVERQSPSSRKVAGYSVRPTRYGSFLCEILDEWAAHDIGRIFVQLFESTLGVWIGRPPSTCVFSAQCGRALVVEHNGDLYACDHFVYPEHLRGQVTLDGLADLVDSPEQRAFGMVKADLADECRACRVLRFCGGDCPKHRTNQGSGGHSISYLCTAYQEFFSYSETILGRMAVEITRHSR